MSTVTNIQNTNSEFFEIEKPIILSDKLVKIIHNDQGLQVVVCDSDGQVFQIESNRIEGFPAAGGCPSRAFIEECSAQLFGTPHEYGVNFFVGNPEESNNLLNRLHEEIQQLSTLDAEKRQECFARIQTVCQSLIEIINISIERRKKDQEGLRLKLIGLVRSYDKNKTETTSVRGLCEEIESKMKNCATQIDLCQTQISTLENGIKENERIRAGVWRHVSNIFDRNRAKIKRHNAQMEGNRRAFQQQLDNQVAVKSSHEKEKARLEFHLEKLSGEGSSLEEQIEQCGKDIGGLSDIISNLGEKSGNYEYCNEIVGVISRLMQSGLLTPEEVGRFSEKFQQIINDAGRLTH